MKKRISMMIVFALICCMAMPTTIYATASGVSGNDVVEEPKTDGSVEDEPSIEEPPADEDTTGEEVIEEEVNGEEPVEEETADEEEEETSGGGALAVDGYYDDWENVPQTLISYGSHNSDGTINEFHSGALLVSGDYVYVYVRMSDLYQQHIPVDELKLTINGQEKSFIIRGRDGQNINWGKDVYNLPEGINGGLGIFYRDGGNVSLGDAVITIGDANPNDSFEFCMSIADLEALYGLPEGTISNGAKIEFFSPNIGPEKVTVVGTSTGTYIGILLCVAVVMAAMYGKKIRKQAWS